MRKNIVVLVAAVSSLCYIAAVLALRTGNNARSKLSMLVVEYALLLPAASLVVMWERRTAPEPAAAGRKPRWWPLVAVYLAVTLPLAFALRRGIYNADESAYLFESKAMLAGAVAAKAPPVTSADARFYQDDFFFENHVIYGSRWFGKYPPGWPALLAAGMASKMEWLLNPFLGLATLWLTVALARRLYDERVARLSALLLVLSPFFVLNAVGYMSHPACGAAIAGAALLLHKGLASRRLAHFAGMFALLACAFLMRPATAFAAGAVLGAALCWGLRREPARLVAALALGVLLCGAAAAGLLLHNRALTGDPLLSPYAVSRNTRLPVEVNPRPANLVWNLRAITSISLAKTALDAVPFLFLLAACVPFFERRLWTLLLAALFLALVAVYLPQVEVSDSVVGERYYFEAYFAVAILAARGWTRFADFRRVPRYIALTLAGGLIAVQVFHFGLLVNTMLRIKTGYGRVLEAVDGLRLDRAVVLMKPAPGFGAKNFNPNAADWERAPVFYVKDPGPARRQEVVCALGRPRWVVVSYRRDLGQAIIVDRGDAACSAEQAARR
ncbi:MAG TPA: glycosyltransferase family 39 protein [Bryobacteraceae bacterium]|nr:glycosyltransferase family 39 protein [Bryobacteraceae bacterium]